MSRNLKELCEANRPILVTGSNRSGSTWLGKMLATAPEAVYVHEPFNPDTISYIHHMVPPPFDKHFHYVRPEDEAQLVRYLEHRLGLGYPFWKDVQVRPDPKRFLGALKRWWRYERLYPKGKRFLLKDPLALMSVDWFHREMNPQIVISTRHPAAYVSSIMRLGWDVGPQLFLPQQELMAEHLQEFSDDLTALAQQKERDILGEAILAWRIFHHMILEYQKRIPDIMTVRNEDLSLDPLAEYQKLFEQLSLTFTSEAEQTIRAHSQSENPSEAESKRADQIARDSKTNITSWKKRFSTAEIDRIREATEAIAQNFYSDSDW